MTAKKKSPPKRKRPTIAGHVANLSLAVTKAEIKIGKLEQDTAGAFRNEGLNRERIAKLESDAAQCRDARWSGSVSSKRLDDISAKVDGLQKFLDRFQPATSGNTESLANDVKQLREELHALVRVTHRQATCKTCCP